MLYAKGASFSARDGCPMVNCEISADPDHDTFPSYSMTRAVQSALHLTQKFGLPKTIRAGRDAFAELLGDFRGIGKGWWKGVPVIFDESISSWELAWVKA